jgi:predicted nucleotide-binding protein (sugar kinase/HSP70/actin superfamily)
LSLLIKFFSAIIEIKKYKYFTLGLINMAKEELKNKKVAFPHMGTIHIAWAAALRKIGVEPFEPPYTNKKTLTLGTKNSPEAICLPYKLILGNFMEALEGGADYVAMITSPGCCRLGEYGSSIKNALTDMGYQANYIELALYDGIKGLYHFLRELTGKNDIILFTKAIYTFIRTIFVLDDLENAFSYYRAREVKVGTAENHFKKCLKMISSANSIKELKQAKKDSLIELSKTEIDKTKDILHVVLTGEIYMVLDYFGNQNIERELGRMGVQTRRSLTVGGFLKDAIIPKIFKKGETHLERAYRMAQPYLMRDIGGDALECVSDVAWADEHGKDGIIHISPFTCMPEIMSQNIFPSMRENCNIPILTLIMDEQTGKAGYITRLEAFVDLMRRKKRKSSIKIGQKNKELTPAEK